LIGKKEKTGQSKRGKREATRKSRLDLGGYSCKKERGSAPLGKGTLHQKREEKPGGEGGGKKDGTRTGGRL